MDAPRLANAGAPVTSIWAWVVTDADGNEALCRSPWSEAAALIGPDEDRVGAPSMGEWCRAYYGPHGWTVELRRFDLAHG